jgi:hypothetical protein
MARVGAIENRNPKPLPRRYEVAKRIHDQVSQRQNSTLRVRWVEVEVNGADTTIEEALRTVERMRRPVIEVPPPPKRIADVATSTRTDAPPSHQPSLFDGEEENQEIDEAADPSVDGADDSGDGTSLPRKKRGQGEAKDRNAGIKPIGDIDFVPKEGKSLKTFFTEKSPASDMDQILVICHFLQYSSQSVQIGPGHILSGFRHVGKPVPKDLKQTIRNMKDKKAWLGYASFDDIRLTTEGDNRVEHELGKDNGDAGTR